MDGLIYAKAGVRCLGFWLISLLIPLGVFAQGVPKAYEAVIYRAKLNGLAVTFILADGYIGASVVKMRITANKKIIVFEPEVGEADEKSRLKFINKGNDYFIIYNMQTAYDEIPSFITGKYYKNDTMTNLKFRLVKK